MQRLLIASTLLHLYIALRLLPGLGEAGLPGWALGLFALYLLTSAVLMPLALLSRPMPQPRRDRLAWPGITYVRVTPTWMRFCDYTVMPPSIVEWSMTTQ